MKTHALRAGQFVEFVLLVKGMKHRIILILILILNTNTNLNGDMTVAVVGPGSFLGLIDNC